MNDKAKSVKDKLKNIAKANKENFDSVRLQYVMERFLYRLSTSEISELFVLKGGVLFYLWTGNKFRPTKDLDFLFFGDLERRAKPL